MLRVPAICMLIVVQLFAGSGRSVYLCVRSDGTISGFDLGPWLCLCDDHTADRESLARNDAQADECQRAACCSHNHGSIEHDELSEATTLAMTERDCHCDHTLVSCENARSATRISISDVLNFAALTTALSAPREIVQAIVSGYSIPYYAAPPDIQTAAAARATVAIRS